MRDIFTAIYNHYSSDPLAAAVTDMYNTKARESAEMPYIVFQLISDTPDWTFSENFENCLVQFNIFSDKPSAVEICNIFELLKGDTALATGFDFLDLSVTNYEVVSLVRENAILTQDDFDIWLYNVTYRLEMQSTGIAAKSVTVGMYNLIHLL